MCKASPPSDRQDSLRNKQRFGWLIPLLMLGSLAAAGPPAGIRPDVAAQRKSLRLEARNMPGWKLGETEHFFILTNVKRDEFIGELKLRLEAIQSVFETDFPSAEARPSPKKTRAPKSLVRVFGKRQEYAAHGGPEGSAGYWNASRGELVLQAQTGESGLKQTWSTLSHEAFHQFIYYYLGETTPHTWYDEGHGDYYGSYRFHNGKYEQPRRAFAHAALGAALGAGECAELRDFIHWTKGEYYGTNDLLLPRHLTYAQGNSLIHFLRSGAELFPAGWQTSWDRILPRYRQTFASTGRPELALKFAFHGVNLSALELCWKRTLLTI